MKYSIKLNENNPDKNEGICNQNFYDCYHQYCVVKSQEAEPVSMPL